MARTSRRIQGPPRWHTEPRRPGRHSRLPGMHLSWCFAAGRPRRSGSMNSELTVGSLAAALDAAFPHAWADGWDNVGLISGEREAAISGVLVTLDATAEAVAA